MKNWNKTKDEIKAEYAESVKQMACRFYYDKRNDNNTLLNDLWGRKEILFIHKMFSLDFSELDKQENHDLRAQIQQNENWADWGLMMVQEVYESFMISVIGIFSGIALTITLFS